LRAAFDGQVIQENTTVSSGLRCTAMVKDGDDESIDVAHAFLLWWFRTMTTNEGY
jgi:hypothetical protein